MKRPVHVVTDLGRPQRRGLRRGRRYALDDLALAELDGALVIAPRTTEAPPWHVRLDLVDAGALAAALAEHLGKRLAP